MDFFENIQEKTQQFQEKTQKLKTKTQDFGKVKNAVCRKRVQKKACIREKEKCFCVLLQKNNDVTKMQVWGQHEQDKSKNHLKLVCPKLFTECLLDLMMLIYHSKCTTPHVVLRVDLISY